jgi:hypothetical protein
MIAAISSATSRPDEPIGAVANQLHAAAVVAIGVVGAAVLYAWLERRGRRRWSEVPVKTRIVVAAGPYRTSDGVAGRLAGAPAAVKTAAFVSLAFAHVFAPLVVIALASYPFDGIAIPLLPGMALIVLDWCCAWLLLARSPSAYSIGRAAASASMLANVALLLIAGAHLGLVELDRQQGLQHSCSSSVTLVVLLFAVASVGQALMMKGVLRSSAPALTWADPVHSAHLRPRHGLASAASAGPLTPPARMGE